MAEITASLVKALREQTGAGMMDCKAALKETDGDMDAAVDWLRKKGLSKAAKKAGRVAADGLVAVAVKGSEGAVIEVNAETDFVARNEEFQGLVRTLAELALEKKADKEALEAAEMPGAGKPVSEHMTDMIARIGENLQIRRVSYLSVPEGAVAAYMHNQIAEGLGKIGVIVAVSSSGDAERVAELGRKVAMHVAATNPLALGVDDLDADVVERERAVLVDQARQSGKPDNIIEKMVEGRIRKFYEEVVLLQQAFVLDPDTTVGKAVDAEGKELGAPTAVTAFARFALGEGIEKEESDFAQEVAAAAGS